VQHFEKPVALLLVPGRQSGRQLFPTEPFSCIKSHANVLKVRPWVAEKDPVIYRDDLPESLTNPGSPEKTKCLITRTLAADLRGGQKLRPLAVI